jgi:RNA polymerase sigma-70 factor (ECF subfamily)
VITPDEQQLVLLLKQGDALALEKLFHQYHAPLCILAFRLLRDHDKAKDVVQEVFIKVWKGRESLEVSYSLQAYLKRAVVNTALNIIDQNSRRKNVSLEENIDRPDPRGASSDQELSELQKAVNDALEQLPPRTKAVFTLIRMEEMTYREVASTLAISEKAVEKEMMKALKLLRTALRDYLPALIAAILLS